MPHTYEPDTTLSPRDQLRSSYELQRGAWIARSIPSSLALDTHRLWPNLAEEDFPWMTPTEVRAALAAYARWLALVADADVLPDLVDLRDWLGSCGWQEHDPDPLRGALWTRADHRVILPAEPDPNLLRPAVEQIAAAEGLTLDEVTDAVWRAAHGRPEAQGADH